MKKICCFIDNLGAGGAQRQIVGLARMLVINKYDVKVVYYQDNRFFEGELLKCGVDSFFIKGGSNKLLLFWNIFQFFKSERPDVVISYLESPSMVACVLRMIGQKYTLIVSERNTNIKITIRDRLRFQLFRMAEYVVPNSYSQQHFMEKECAFLKGKIVTITNFCSFLSHNCKERNRKQLPEIVIAASIWEPKNTLRFIRAVKILKDKGFKFHVSWYGKVGYTPYYQKCVESIKSLGVSDRINLYEKTKNIAEVYLQSDYFCLPSLYEGTPNVICEALCMSLPIICSDICDNGIYVKNNENGFLFNPYDVSNMASCLEKALILNDDEYVSFSKMSREIAESKLSENIFINKYINLIENG